MLMRHRRPRSPSTSTPPTIRCTATRKGASSTATTTATAICRSMCFAAVICWPPNCARPTSTPAPAVSRRWRGSSPAFASAGPRCAFCCADSGFAREALMAWCEDNGVDYLFGLAKNIRLVAEIEAELAAAQEQSQQTQKPARRFKDFTWRTRKSWSCARRVVAKAEWTGGAANPRFVVTSLTREEHEARHLYEQVYCARGEMENRIKECQLDLYADRTSAHTMRANPAAAMVRLDGLCADLRLTPHRPQAHPVRPRLVRHHPPQTAEDRGAGAHQRAPHQARYADRLSLSGRVQCRPCCADRGCDGLTNQKAQQK